MHNSCQIQVVTCHSFPIRIDFFALICLFLPPVQWNGTSHSQYPHIQTSSAPRFHPPIPFSHLVLHHLCWTDPTGCTCCLPSYRPFQIHPIKCIRAAAEALLGKCWLAVHRQEPEHSKQARLPGPLAEKKLQAQFCELFCLPWRDGREARLRPQVVNQHARLLFQISQWRRRPIP